MLTSFLLPDVSLRVAGPLSGSSPLTQGQGGEYDHLWDYRCLRHLPVTRRDKMPVGTRLHTAPLANHDPLRLALAAARGEPFPVTSRPTAISLGER